MKDPWSAGFITKQMGFRSSDSGPAHVRTFLDRDSYCYLDVIPREDTMTSEWGATVVYNGYPVMFVGVDDQTFLGDPSDRDSGITAAVIALLTFVGHFPEDAYTRWLDGEDIWEADDVDDGHQICGFVDDIHSIIDAERAGEQGG